MFHNPQVEQFSRGFSIQSASPNQTVIRADAGSRCGWKRQTHVFAEDFPRRQLHGVIINLGSSDYGIRGHLPHAYKSVWEARNRSDVGRQVGITSPSRIPSVFTGRSLDIAEDLFVLRITTGSQASPTFLSKLTVDTMSSYGGLNLVAR